MQQTSKVQAPFLNKLIQDKTSIAVYLRNGIKLTGQLTSANQETLYLSREVTCCIYKKHVSVIMPFTE